MTSMGDNSSDTLDSQVQITDMIPMTSSKCVRSQSVVLKALC